MPKGLAAFSITPQEDFLTGVRYEGQTLTLRPSTPYQVMEVVAIICGAGVAAWGWLVLATMSSVPETPVNLGRLATGILMAIVGVGWALSSVARLRSSVVASPARVLVRNGLKTEMLVWADVASVGVQEAKPSGWRFGGLLPWNAAPVGLSWQTTFAEVTPVITLATGRQIACTPLVTQTRSEGMSFGEPTAAEVKAGLLARYHAAVLGVPPTYVPEPARK